jgi:phosphatidylserine/phosphatidylglycerophosphate/cardiolipin synthase-like enzyme
MFNYRSSVSGLYDQNTFDKQFLKDIARARNSLVIESPFIRVNRVEQLIPVIAKLRRRGVSVIINTRSPEEHDDIYETQATDAITMLQNLGVTVLFTVKHHRKIAVIDREVFYEGSLNILSYYDSCEIMRRTVSSSEAEVLLRFIELHKYLTKVS